MPIIVNLDVMMAKRKISLGELAERIDLTPANLSILKTEKPRRYAFLPWKPSVRNSTVSRAISWSTGRMNEAVCIFFKIICVIKNHRGLI